MEDKDQTQGAVTSVDLPPAASVADIIDTSVTATDADDEADRITLKDVRRIDVQAGDVLVLRTPLELSDKQRQMVADQCARIFPQDVRMVVLGPGWQMEVVRAENVPPVITNVTNVSNAAPAENASDDA